MHQLQEDGGFHPILFFLVEELTISYHNLLSTSLKDA
jgi:hypothetical protein